MILLTQNSTAIFEYIVKGLGLIMNAVFEFLYLIGIPKVGIAIVLFTIVIYMLLTPLTYRQQKFSKMSAIMNPELQAIQAKYKGKKDNESMQAQNAETQAVYAKYGVSPSGSCVQLVIQMPILFGLYRVIYAMPAYVTKIKEAFLPYASQLINTKDTASFMTDTQNFSAASQFSKQIEESAQYFNEATGLYDVASGTPAYDTVSNTMIDVLNRASTSELMRIDNVLYNTDFIANNAETVETYTEVYSAYGADTLATFSDVLSNVANDVTLKGYNTLFGLNMGQSPWGQIQQFITDHSYGLVLVALLIPLLAAATQWISIKLNPQQNQRNTGNEQNAMASSMKTMNYVMPVMSLVFCFTLPAGLGLYWIMGAVVRTVQQIIINKHIDKTDLHELLEQNKEKNKKKQSKKEDRLRKAGIDPSSMNAAARMSTRNIDSKTNSTSTTTSTTSNTTSSGSGSLASKAGLVRKYNEQNKK